jgi:CHAT domain-containing protein/tetratricopeptide (TPR) repeat protein
MAEGSAAEPQALLDRGLYDLAEDAARARVDALIASTGNDSLEVAAASDLLVQALVLNGKGTSASTLTLAVRTVQRKEVYLGTSHVDLIPSLLNFSDALLAAGEYGRAVETARRAVTLRERSKDTTGTELAQALDHLGAALTASGRYDDALIALERSLQARESALSRIDVRIARTLEAIGWALQRKGDYERAGARLRRAAAIQEEADFTHPAYAETLNLLGLQFWFEGNLPEARELSTRAVAVAERTLRPDHPTIARALRYKAGAFIDLGDLTQGRSLLERALGIAERTFGPSHFETWAYVNDLAIAELYLGRYTAARALFERALRVAEARLGLWNERVATTMGNLALVDARLGDYGSARREHARATAIWERVLGRDHPFVAQALMDLAAVYREQGASSAALPLLERALAIRERRLGPEHRDVASTLSDLAATLRLLGRITRAQGVAARAVRIWERADAPEAPEFATVLKLYADLQADRGEAADARRYYDRALAIEEKALGRAHPAFADTQVGLATALASLGDHDPAIEAAIEAETTGRDHLRLMLRYLPERQSLTYAATRPKGLDLALSLSGTDPQATSRVFDALVRTRALVLDEMAARRRVRADASGDMAPLWAALNSARQRLANLVVRGPSDQRPEQYVKLVEDARREKELAERALADKSATFSNELSREEIGLGAVRGALPPRSALVAFVRYDRTVIANETTVSRGVPKPPRRLRIVPSYMAFIVRTDRPAVSMVPLGSAGTLDALVASWHAETTGVLHASSALEAERTYRLAGASLRRRVWDPIAVQVKDEAIVFIVPDGTLNLLSLAALPVGRARYLIDDGPVIHYLSAERDLVTGEAVSTTGRGLLAVGGAAFDDPTLFTGPLPVRQAASTHTQSAKVRGACGDLPSLHFDPLDATGQEVQDVARLWTGSPVQLLQNRGASERAFKQAAAGHRVLHLATHGFFLGSDCSPAVGTRGVGGLAVAPTIRSNAGTIDNPLLLSGLALAGANRRAAAGPTDEDGILTSEEVVGLNLDGVEWAVLSACDTGLGVVKAGEGVFGLRRAFQIAGVHTVIMSLWPVEDQAARDWMRALYEGRLKKKLTTADAVHQASLTVLHARRTAKESTHPFYWAGFAAAGDWR